MKAVLPILLCALLTGCFHYHNVAPKGNNTPAKTSSLSDFTGVYQNSGLGAPPAHASLSSFLMGYSDSRLERSERLRLSCQDEGILLFEVLDGTRVLERKVMKPDMDYVFREGKIFLDFHREAGSSGSDAFPSVALRSHRKTIWLTKNKDLVGESVFSASGVAMGFIPGGGYSRDAWRWTRIRDKEFE